MHKNVKAYLFMVKVFIILSLLLLSLEARDNPFFPSTGELDIPLNANQEFKEKPLKRATITLPSSARTIESVTIKYKNLDGSIVSTTEELGNSIDWHLPVFISQNYVISAPNTKVTNKIKYKRVTGLKFITLYQAGKKLKIVTKDKLIRNFLLVKPHRIVCDFARDIDVRSYEKNLSKNSIIKNVRFGNHDGYYRVVIELDGYYSYSTQKIKNSYIFTLR